jgi:carotenoid cleavage dioxygenase-like enzyme
MPGPELDVSEPIVVARDQTDPDDETNVWVLIMCHDGPTDRSCVVILDGRDPEAGPVAKLWFDQTIPMTFHGAWRSTG